MTIKQWFNLNKDKLFRVNGKEGFLNYADDEYLSMNFGRKGGITKISLKDIVEMQVLYPEN